MTRTNGNERPAPPGTDPPVVSKRRRLILRLAVYPLLAALLAALTGVVVAASIQRPQVDTIDDFVPKLITRLYDSSGEQLRTYSRENRVMLEEGEVPELLKQAILAIEDVNFESHGGIDLRGILRAVVKNLQRGRLSEGASTLTMQLARDLFSLTRERDVKRKIEEAFLAVELEKKFSKQQILTLYCNMVNLSNGNYGMEAAARNYFGKSVDELTLAQAATLAGIPQRPTDHNPVTRPETVVKRRNVVLARMLEVGFIDQEQHDRAVAEELILSPPRTDHELGPYFSEEVRRFLISTYGETELYDRGLQVHTTLDPEIQMAAEAALRTELVALDHRFKSWRGPIDQIEGQDLDSRWLPSWNNLGSMPGERWFKGSVVESGTEKALVKIDGKTLELTPAGIEWTRRHQPSSVLEPGDVAWFSLRAGNTPDEEVLTLEPVEGERWYQGLVLESDTRKALVKIAGETFELGSAGIAWTRRRQPSRVLEPGDVAWFSLRPGKDGGVPVLTLEQEPEMEAAVLVLESGTGAVRAMVGGWSYDRNEFNRATQARRQVGSAFKPFVYGAALEIGFTAADTIFDGPVIFPGATPEDAYSPRNFYRKYNGVMTLRRALEKSVNVHAVKLMDVVGVERVIDFARRCGITAELPPYPSLALGVAEIQPIELAAAYATFANKGVYVEPYTIERITSRNGRVMQEHTPHAYKAMEPATAYLLTNMLQGVAQRGTGAVRLAKIELATGGKTGTTNNYTDAWFVGFTPRYTILTWVGYDKKRFLGRNMTGAEAALPIWSTLVSRGLEEEWLSGEETFEVPPGIIEREIEPTTGLLASPAGASIVEVFVEGTEPEKAFDADWARIIQLPWYLQEPYYVPKEGERMPSEVVDWQMIVEGWEDKEKGRRRTESDSATSPAGP